MANLRVLIVVLIQLTEALIASGGCDDFSLVSRARWGARKPESESYIEGSVGMAFVHHTVTTSCTSLESCSAQLKSIQRDHMNRTDIGNDIGYSFLIGEDGRVYEGRTWGVVGAHTKGYNSRAYGFSVIGNFMNRAPNQAALDALQGIIDCGVELGHLDTDYELFGHRDVKSTECPGKFLYSIIQGWPHYSHRLGGK